MVFGYKRREIVNTHSSKERKKKGANETRQANLHPIAQILSSTFSLPHPSFSCSDPFVVECT